MKQKKIQRAGNEQAVTEESQIGKIWNRTEQCKEHSRTFQNRKEKK